MNTIDIIVAIRNTDVFQRCLLASLETLVVPEGWNVQVIGVTSKEGKAQIYDAAMKEVNSKYKIYVDESCRIVNTRFIVDMLDIFAMDSEIGALGVVGTKQLPIDGIFSHAKQYIGCLNTVESPTDGEHDKLDYEEVVAVDSCVLATAEDFEWRQDLFNHDEFVISSQCMEFQRKGKKVVVPKANHRWVRSFKNETNNLEYEERITFVREYGAEFQPLVTVLVPTYNRPDFCEQALKSILDQTYQNIEIIVSDDGDNDLTEKMIQPYLTRDKRIRYVHHKNFTARDNWNYLESYNNDEAEYEAWLMDDDLYLSEKIEKMMNCFSDNEGVSLVTSRRQVIDAAGNNLPDNRATVPVVSQTSRISGESAGRKVLIEMLNYIGEPSTVLIKKKYLKDGHLMGGFFSKKATPLTDVSTWLYMLEQGDMIYISEPLSCYRVHAEQSQGDVRTAIKGQINWAVLIQHYWKKKVFLVEEKDYRLAVFQYLIYTFNLMSTLENANYDSDDYRLLCRICVMMCHSLENGYRTDFTVPDAVWEYGD